MTQLSGEKWDFNNPKASRFASAGINTDKTHALIVDPASLQFAVFSLDAWTIYGVALPTPGHSLLSAAV